MTQHITGEIFGQQVNLDTLYYAWGTMALVLVIAAYLGSSLQKEVSKYGMKEHLAESVVSFFRILTTGQIGKRGDQFVPLVGSIFIFILVNYYAGLLPWQLGKFFHWWPTLPSHGEEHAHIWHGASTCADINVPAAISILVVLIYFAAGAMIGGWKYIQMFLPINFSKEKGLSLNLMCLIELMDLLIRPLTLTLRLFANTVAGETLLATFIGLVALVIPVVVLGFEMFVGLLQAFLFAILTCVYIGGAVQHAEHLVHDAEHH
jgi:F-type H+-transporting ATPase subunit a